MIQYVMRKEKPSHKMTDEGLNKARAEIIRPQLEVVDDDLAGFPKGTRTIFVFAFPLYELLLVKADNRLRIAWAYYNPGD